MEVTRKIANLQLKGKRRYFVLLVFWKQRFVCVVLAVLELALETRLASNSEIYLPLPLEYWD